MRFNHYDIFERACQVIIFVMVMACFMMIMSSCRILKSHKSKSQSTLDSTHQVINKKSSAIKTDSTAHSDKKDTASKQTWWNYEKQTTTVTEWIPPVQVDTTNGKTWAGGTTWVSGTGVVYTPSSGIIKQTTITNERGQQYIQETNSNRDILDVDLSRIDTSSVQQSQTTQVQKTSSNQVTDKKVTAIPTWLVIAMVLMMLVCGWLYLSPGAGPVTRWILAIFKRKKPQDKS